MDAVVFDLDGVVVDTEKYWNMAEEEIYAEAVGPENTDTQELAGMSITNTYQYLSEHYDISLTRDEFFHLYEERAEEIYMEKASLMDGLKQLIKELRQKDLKIGLATGSYWPDYAIERFELEFDAVVHSGMIDGAGKPEPETYRTAVEKLGVGPAEAVAVDDTDVGIKSAKGAGLYCIGYAESEGQSFSRADEVVSSPDELRRRLLELV